MYLYQINLTKGRDASREVVEEASRRGGQNPKGGRRPVEGRGRPAPSGSRQASRCFGCLLDPS